MVRNPSMYYLYSFYDILYNEHIEGNNLLNINLLVIGSSIVVNQTSKQKYDLKDNNDLANRIGQNGSYSLYELITTILIGNKLLRNQK